MMKQPAENTNATLAEEQQARERARPEPVFTAADEQEMIRLATEQASRRGASTPEEQDVLKAREIIRNRKISLPKP